MVSEERLEQIIRDFNPLLGIFTIIVILNLGAPLDYHAILGAGFYTLVYILVRACGKYFEARFGAKITEMQPTVQKYLGFTLLPHSGVSLVFTGITVSILAGPAPECAEIIQGTIAATAVLNVVVAKKDSNGPEDNLAQKNKRQHRNSIIFDIVFKPFAFIVRKKYKQS